MDPVSRAGDDPGHEDTADYEDGGMTAADWFGDGVYQPETDPEKIAAAERSLNALRARLNKPLW